MEHHAWKRDDSISACQGRMTAVILLAALLACVFFLALGAYGYYETSGEESLSGDLPDAVLALRDLVERNEAVAVFLGLAPEDAIETMGKPIPAPHIREAADAYIREKQG